MEKQTKIKVLLGVISIVLFVLSSLCFAKELRATPLFYLSKKDFADIKDVLKLDSPRAEQINAVLKNKLETQQVLIKNGNKLIRIMDAYDAIKNKKQYWDNEAIAIASGLSQIQIDQIHMDWEQIETLKIQAHMIDDLKIRAILDSAQIAQWYKYKFYHYAEWILSQEDISVDKDILTQKASKAVDDMLLAHHVIDQKIVDEFFLNMRSELQSINRTKQ